MTVLCSSALTSIIVWLRSETSFLRTWWLEAKYTIHDAVERSLRNELAIVGSSTYGLYAFWPAWSRIRMFSRKQVKPFWSVLILFLQLGWQLPRLPSHLAVSLIVLLHVLLDDFRPYHRGLKVSSKAQSAFPGKMLLMHQPVNVIRHSTSIVKSCTTLNQVQTQKSPI